MSPNQMDVEGVNKLFIVLFGEFGKSENEITCSMIMKSLVQ